MIFSKKCCIVSRRKWIMRSNNSYKSPISHYLFFNYFNYCLFIIHNCPTWFFVNLTRNYTYLGKRNLDRESSSTRLSCRQVCEVLPILITDVDSPARCRRWHSLAGGLVFVDKADWASQKEEASKQQQASLLEVLSWTPQQCAVSGAIK